MFQKTKSRNPNLESECQNPESQNSKWVEVPNSQNPELVKILESKISNVKILNFKILKNPISRKNQNLEFLKESYLRLHPRLLEAKSLISFNFVVFRVLTIRDSDPFLILIYSGLRPILGILVDTVIDQIIRKHALKNDEIKHSAKLGLQLVEQVLVAFW